MTVALYKLSQKKQKQQQKQKQKMKNHIKHILPRLITVKHRSISTSFKLP